MKTSVPILFLWFFFISALTTKADLVFDSDGDALKNGGLYKLSPVSPVGENEVIGALIRKSPESNECWFGVIQYTVGWSVTIEHFQKPSFISTDLPVTITFVHMPPNVCTNSTKWAIVKKPLVDGKYKPVMLADDDSHEFPHGDVVHGRFFVKPYDYEKNEYKLVFSHHQVYKNIGIHVDEEHSNWKRLVVKDDGKPLVFKFHKSDYVNENSESVSQSVLSMVV